MFFSCSLAQLRQIINLVEVNNFQPAITVSGISTDTRTLKPGEAFLALSGANFDGHNFASLAIEKGASALITSRSLDITPTIPQLIVADTLRAYQQIAHWWREQFQIPIIAVTGSVGKTTTKELIAGILETEGKVHKTLANYNNEIGVPKTLLALTPEHDYAVIEMAMRGKGEIALLTEIARPTIGVITNVGTAHIGRLGSQEAIAAAKCELLAKMSRDAVAILNYDNPLLIKTAAQVWQGETVTFGLTGGDITGTVVAPQTLKIEGIDLPLPLAGTHNAINYLAALAVGKVLGIDWQNFQQGLTINMPAGRSQILHLANDILVLDETYNAGLESMIAALRLLQETPGKRHIAVLGAMKELGAKSDNFHQQVGEFVKQLQLDYLLILDTDSVTKNIAIGAAGIPTDCLNSHQEILEKLKDIVQTGDRILFKASHSVGLEQVVRQFSTEISIGKK